MPTASAVSVVPDAGSPATDAVGVAADVAPDQSAGVSTTTTTTSEHSTTTSTIPMFSGDAGSRWCGVSAELAVLSNEFEAASVTDAAEVERTFTAFVDRMALIVFVAPSDIVEDVVTSVEAFTQLRTLLAGAEFDMTVVDVSSIEGQLADIAPASARIAAYNRDVCRVGSDAVSNSLPPLPGSTASAAVPTPDTVRDAVIALLVDGGYTEVQAECIAEGLSVGTPTDAVLSKCGVSLDGAG